PNPEAYRTALATIGATGNVWMIGDNITADVLGAEAAGLRAILVRTEDPRANRRAASLRDVRRFLD
ncbi:MAG TPA: HAD hydrolase-like protein, partial [Verrucomicrobiae bacterium]|nr:HAD hydrolase-like protein [Verrucomicrobiae bacterium]